MSNQFQINALTVRNYRSFKELSVSFEPELTVLVARNGEGKTAILDAVKIAYGTFTRNFPVSANASFQASDVHIASAEEAPSLGAVYPVALEATGMLNDKEVAWGRALQKAHGKTTTKEANVLSDYGKSLFQAMQQTQAPVDLPLIAFYGTGRLWAEHKIKGDDAISMLAKSRFTGYEYALTANSTYKQVRQWLIEALLLEDSKSASKTQQGQFVATQLQAIRTALGCVLNAEGLSNMHYNPFYKDDITVMSNDSDGVPDRGASTALPVSWLSDGIRAVFSMVADIAYRCAKLNPHLGEQCCQKTSGIVLVDEIDIFLHPAWQQHVLLDLRKAFPNIQFIVTTHSPQVISSIPKECVRILNNGVIIFANTQTQGVESQDILADIFGTDPAPQDDKYVCRLAEYARMEAQGLVDSEEGRKLYEELAAHFGEDYPPLLRIEIHRKFIATKNGGQHA